VVKNLGKIIQTQFRLTEISSAITIGKVVGTIITREQDATIWKPLSLQHGIHFTRLPNYLEHVKLYRSEDVSGERQRVIRYDSKMPGINLKSIEGIATFLVLIVRYVETPHGIVQYIEHPLKCDYYILDGGELEEPNSGLEIIMLPLSSSRMSYSSCKCVAQRRCRFAPALSVLAVDEPAHSSGG